jgi:hypothetical protein
VENWRFGDSPHDERNDESEGRNGRLDGSGVGEVGVAEIKQEQQLAAEDAAYQTLKPDKFCATAFGYNALFVLLTSSDLAAFPVSQDEEGGD